MLFRSEIRNLPGSNVIRVYDYTGKLVSEKITDSGNLQINLAFLSEGIYTVVIQNGTDEVYRSKIMKQ